MKNLILRRLLTLWPNILTIVIVALIVYSSHGIAAPTQQAAAPDLIPGAISYQGNLTNKSGQPINGTVEMTFSLYNAPNGGSPIWQEIRSGSNSVPVSKGLFNLYLGGLTPIPVDIWKNQTLYLGIKVGGEPEMAPRERIGAVPVALVANMALSVPDLSIGPNQLANNSVTSSKLALNYGKACFAENTTVNIPANYQLIPVPNVSLSLNLSHPSHILFWMDGSARLEQATSGEIEAFIMLDSTVLLSSYSDLVSNWWNIDRTHLENVAPGQHTLRLGGASLNGGAFTVHSGTCINYLVLDED